jgi:hypothetical protein
MGAPVPPLDDADRDRLARVLREHYAQGRLDEAELDRRIGIVLSAQQATEAAAAVADLPPIAGPPAPGPAAPAARRARRRHAQTVQPDSAWVPTAERFRDPSSGVIMRVWLDPADGSRHYVPDDGG